MSRRPASSGRMRWAAHLTLECLVMLRAGQTAAQSRAADFEVVALLNGVCLVQQRIDRAGNGLAGVGVQRLVAVDQDAQEPVWAFLLKADIPQAKAHAFDNGTARASTVLTALPPLFCCFAMKFAPIIKESGPCGPLSNKIIIEQ